MSVTRPRYELKRVFDDGIEHAPELVPVTSMPWDIQSGRRGYLGASLTAAAALLGLDPALAQNRRPAQRTPPRPAPTSSAGPPLPETKAPGPVHMAHTSSINTLAVSTDGTRLASSSSDHTIKIWATDDGRLLQVLNGHTESVEAAAFTADGSHVVSASGDRTVRVWSLSTGTLAALLEGHKNRVTCLAVSSDGRVAASGSWDNSVRLWSIPDGRSLAALEPHKSFISSVAIAPDGQTMVSASQDGVVRLWSLPSGQLVTALQGHQGSVHLTISRDGRTLATGSSDGVVKLWSLPEGRLLATCSGPGSRQAVNATAFTPDGAMLVAAGATGDIRLWTVPEGRLDATLNGHFNAVVALAVNADGRTLASSSADNTTRLWSLADRKEVAILRVQNSRAEAVAFAGATLFSADQEGSLTAWDVSGPRFRSYLFDLAIDPIKAPQPESQAHTDRVHIIASSRDGGLVLTGSRDNTTKIWSRAGQRWVATLTGHTGNIEAGELSPDGKLAATASADETIRLWSAADGRLMVTLSGHSAAVTALRINPQGAQLISGSDDHTVWVWSLPDGRALIRLEGFAQPVRQLEVSADGRIVAAASEDRVRVWTLPEGRLLLSVTTRNGICALSPAGDTLVASTYQELELWSVVAGRRTASLQGVENVQEVRVAANGSMLYARANRSVKMWSLPDRRLLGTVDGPSRLAIAPDGKSIASADGNSMRVWSLPQGRQLMTLLGNHSLDSVAWSPDGGSLISGDQEGIAALWDIGARRFQGYLSDPVLNSQQLPEKRLTVHHGSVHALSISPDGKTLCTGGQDDTAKAWTLPEGRLLATLDGHKNSVQTITISADGKTVVTGSEKSIRVWTLPPPSASPTKPPAEVSPPAAPAQAPAAQAKKAAPARKPAAPKPVFPKATLVTTLAEQTDTLHSLTVSSEARVLVSSTDSSTSVWPWPENGPPGAATPLAGHEKKILALAVAPSAGMIATASEDQTVRLWSLDGRPLGVLSGHGGAVTCVTFSRDGETLVSGSNDRTLRVWSVRERRLFAILEGHSSSLRAVAVTPDGSIIASAGEDRSIRLWSRAMGRQLAVLEAHSQAVQHLLVTPDGRLAVTADHGQNSAIRLWSIADGRLSGSLAGPGNITAMELSPDGTLLVVGSQYGSVLIYDLVHRAFRGYLFDPLVGRTDGVTYNVYDKMTGQYITYTMPCGSPIPAGATCVCNCVPAYSPPVPTGGGGGGYRGGGSFCSCNRICTCVPIY